MPAKDETALVPHYSKIPPGPEVTDLDRLAEFGAEVAQFLVATKTSDLVEPDKASVTPPQRAAD